MNGPNSILNSDIPRWLEQLRSERFYGRVSFDLRDGEIVLARTERTQVVSPKSSFLSQGVNHEHKFRPDHS